MVKKNHLFLCQFKKNDYLCTAIPKATTIQTAQMAELVDALVSNTNAARRTGSSPVLGTKKEDAQ